MLDQTISNLLDQSREHDTHKADYKAPANQFRFDEAARIVPPAVSGLFASDVSLPSLAPTPWAWSQVFTKLGPTVFGQDRTLPANYLLALRPDLRAYVLNDHLQHTSRQWFVRSYDDNARAVLSGIYTPISNTEILDILTQVSNGTSQDNHITRDSSVNPDSLNVRIIWKDITRPTDRGGNGSWGIGAAVVNGETGNRKGKILPLIKRGSCDNSIIIDDGVHGFEFLHLGDANAKRVQIKAALVDILPFSADVLTKMIAADEETIPDFADVIAGLSLQYGWDAPTTNNVFIGTEGQDTRAGLVNGITFAAHSIQDPDRQTDLQIVGGSILLAEDSVFHSAKRRAYAEK